MSWRHLLKPDSCVERNRRPVDRIIKQDTSITLAANNSIRERITPGPFFRITVEIDTSRNRRPFAVQPGVARQRSGSSPAGWQEGKNMGLEISKWYGAIDRYARQSGDHPSSRENVGAHAIP
jgi:hypothetical protein